MSRRSGATLVEVLVAIFIMGIGLLALLALFPLGVLNMAQAIQDDRCTQAAANATSYAVAQNLHNDSSLIDTVVNNALVPGPFTNPSPNDQSCVSADPNGPSWPVYVDGVGALTAPAPYNLWVGGSSGQYGITRRSVSYVQGPQLAANIFRWFTLLDDVRFDINGAPASVGLNTFDRDVLYSWAYLLRRPRNGNAGVVDMNVVVYNRRSLNLTAALTMPEYAFMGTIDPVNRPNIVTLTWGPGQNAPAVRAGGWILDATQQSFTNNGKTLFGPSHAQFYRVVGVNELPLTATNLNQIELEVQSNLLGFPAPAQANGPLPTGTFIVLESVVEVFPRGTQWRP